ncbi:MAG: fasciclin domain-containing protein, partial [Pseudomonadota bacterium]
MAFGFKLASPFPFLGRVSDFISDLLDRFHPEPPPENIVDIAVGNGSFDILVKALQTADLADTVRDLDDITVFAPTDAAFAALAADLGYDGDPEDEDAVFDFIAGALGDLAGGDPVPLLTDILLYHVSGGAKTAEEIDDLDA